MTDDSKNPVNSRQDVRRKRLHYQCWHRGIREMDMILGRFADTHLGRLTDTELDVLEDLLKVPDQTFYRWICGTEPVPPNCQSPVYDLVADVTELPEMWHGSAPGKPNS